jgi:hypothetical protein
MPYRCEAASVEGFVQQLACNLVNKGYWYYVVGRIPRGKSARAVDRKLIDIYKLDISKWARARRKVKGQANVAYLRFEDFFVLLATEGAHLLFERESYVKDVRRTPIIFYGYSIGCGKGSDGRYHSSVKISVVAFAELQAHLINICMCHSPKPAILELGSVRFMPFARVRRQLCRLLNEINSMRQTAGFSPLPITCLKLRRKIYRPFRFGDNTIANVNADADKHAE